ncbi:MAG: hypothetical protein AB7F86_00955 [Bdellovibrionales bacterium]
MRRSLVPVLFVILVPACGPDRVGVRDRLSSTNVEARPSAEAKAFFKSKSPKVQPSAYSKVEKRGEPRTVLTEYDSIDQTLESGVRIGLDDRLPKIFTEIDEILAEDFTIDRSELSPLDEVLEDRDHGTEKVNSLRSQIRESVELLRKKKVEIAKMRYEYLPMRDERARLKVQLELIVDNFIQRREEFKEINDKWASAQRAIRVKRKAFARTESGVEHERVGEELRILANLARNLTKELNEHRLADSVKNPKVTELIHDVRSLVDSTQTLRDRLQALRATTHGLRNRVRTQVSELKEIRRSYVAGS